MEADEIITSQCCYADILWETVAGMRVFSELSDGSKKYKGKCSFCQKTIIFTKQVNDAEKIGEEIQAASDVALNMLALFDELGACVVLMKSILLRMIEQQEVSPTPRMQLVMDELMRTCSALDLHYRGDQYDENGWRALMDRWNAVKREMRVQHYKGKER